MLLTEVVNLLKSQRRTLAVAESCTGGLLSKLLTDTAGSSAYFVLGIVAYSNEAKTKLLSIPKPIISRYGAASKEVASRMAQNVRKLAKTDFGLGITGIAGPSGGSKEKPTGTVYIAVDCIPFRICKKFQFKGNRSYNREKTAQKSLKILKKCLKK